MTRAGYATVACLAALLGGGCASLGNDGQADPAICHPDSDSCDVEDFASADEAALRANREAVAVGCMDPGNAGTVQAQQARCAEQVAAALVRLNRRFAGTLAPVSPAQVTYRQRASCADTFVSGREGLDCYDWIQAQVPLRWLTPPPAR
ncbi:hypothetical protein [Lysobacter enzymogenes]|uniref:Lipoprotein n=1 Tax=Lysobacter enzymogenes TaxID=69 RepID=A0AAU9AH20_LYSEN|nr:hypothetical protein [Lysobacter enzymogenes]BAV98542.1 hypothetical protein LEN_3055 [Lysobacter enzymogenes]